MHLLNIFAGLFKYVFIFAYEWYLSHAHKGTIVLHFGNETLNLVIKLQEVLVNGLIAKSLAVHNVFLLLLQTVLLGRPFFFSISR